MGLIGLGSFGVVSACVWDDPLLDGEDLISNLAVASFLCTFSDTLAWLKMRD